MDQKKKNALRVKNLRKQGNPSYTYSPERYAKNYETRIATACKYRAKQKGLEFNLRPKDIIIPSHCPILGIKLIKEFGNGKVNRDNRPSIDRIDNSKGYTRDNIVIVSFRVNRLKSDASLKELSLIYKFYKRIKKGKRPYQ